MRFVLLAVDAKGVHRLMLTQDPEAYAAAYEKANAAPAAPKPAKKSTVATPGEGEGDEFMTIGKGGKTLNLTAEGVFKTLREIFEARGRKVCRISAITTASAELLVEH